MSNEKDQQIINNVKEMIDRGIKTALEMGRPVNFCKFLFDEINADYTSLNLLFQLKKGISLDDYIASRVLERVKELLVYTDLSLTDIARSFGYYNPTYLSKQLHERTGLSSFHFKQIRHHKKALIKIHSAKGD
jgi:AraC family transcriptional regulator